MAKVKIRGKIINHPSISFGLKIGSHTKRNPNSYATFSISDAIAIHCTSPPSKGCLGSVSCDLFDNVRATNACEKCYRAMVFKAEAWAISKCLINKRVCVNLPKWASDITMSIHTSNEIILGLYKAPEV